MKNFILVFLIIFSLVSNSIAQPLSLPEITETVLETSTPTEGDNFVTQHEDITLKLGTLEFPSNFLYKEELAPHQGYLIKFGDFIRIETLFNNINKGCDILYDELLKECGEPKSGVSTNFTTAAFNFYPFSTIHLSEFFPLIFL